ncbi:uncharacterized protein RHOBADRAFT_53202 [Rhodotorula graminis WP1]|uniref:Proteophosphoglycan ppg4 n=1 Tax=Rhodotorula graminis (strain WP1) TaxID=578459 RepID=A0A194S3V7_RHOGW|nr:uncharacterized protein RHOBADRAFT_53202 [Rhodotorula graminis WP1]KPV75190.1 hypothetical protein RHOBADRAFT_53202 [Rhodotorula graminis WP1]
MSRALNPAAQPFVCAAPAPSPSPPSLADLSLADPRAASWARLPVKVKERIVHHVLAIIDEEEAPQGDYSMLPVTVGFFARKEISDKEQMMSAASQGYQLKCLESLNREMRNICSSWLWRALPFAHFDKAALERLEEVLPPHASHVRIVSFGGVTMKPCCGSPLYNPDARARDRVASRVFRMCDNVEEVAMTELRQQPDSVFQLEHLRIATVATSSYGARDFAFLQRQPHLESLFVHSKAPPLASDSIKLAESLSRFAHLKNLRIKGTRLVSTAFLERAIAIPSPLEGIELVSAEADISFDALAAFLVHFSSTLVSLDLNLGNWASSDLWPVDDGTSLELPHLKTLGVGTDFESAFFFRLLSPTMPLSFFRLDFFPSIADDPIALLAFLRAHAATLERVFISLEAIQGTDHWGECHHGVELTREAHDDIRFECEELGVDCMVGFDERTYGGSAAEPVWDGDERPDSRGSGAEDGLDAETASLREKLRYLMRVAAAEGPESLEHVKRRLERTGRVVFVENERFERERFVLEDGRDAETVAEQRRAFVAALAKSKTLEELALGTSNVVDDDDLAAVAFSGPLKHLSFRDAPAFKTFLGNFSTTLESLELDGAPATAPEDESHVEPVDLPKLVALEIATPLTATVFRLFANAPLREISIGESPQITVKDLVGFLEAHKDTLASVDLEEGAVAADDEGEDGEGQGPEELVAAWCEEHGVEFAVIEADDSLASDSEDGDGDVARA